MIDFQIFPHESVNLFKINELTFMSAFHKWTRFFFYFIDKLTNCVQILMIHLNFNNKFSRSKQQSLSQYANLFLLLYDWRNVYWSNSNDAYQVIICVNACRTLIPHQTGFHIFQENICLNYDVDSLGFNRCENNLSKVIRNRNLSSGTMNLCGVKVTKLNLCGVKTTRFRVNLVWKQNNTTTSDADDTSMCLVLL